MEFKQVFLTGEKVKEPSRKKLADEIAALANAKDGTVVLGIDDKTKEIIGIPIDALNAVETWICENLFGCDQSVRRN